MEPSERRLERAFFEREVTAVAKDLLGRVLVSGDGDGDGRVAVRLTEVEAYRGRDDSASHAFRGPTPRTAVMFGPGGHLYTYFVYGMHWCANIVTGPDGNASAVLLRAGEVVDGMDVARSRRPAARTDRLLARGPAGLATVLGLDGSDSGADLCLPDSTIRLHAGSPPPDSAIRTGPRVGVATAAEPGTAVLDRRRPDRVGVPGLDAAPPVGRSRPGGPAGDNTKADRQAADRRSSRVRASTKYSVDHHCRYRSAPTRVIRPLVCEVWAANAANLRSSNSTFALHLLGQLIRRVGGRLGTVEPQPHLRVELAPGPVELGGERRVPEPRAPAAGLPCLRHPPRDRPVVGMPGHPVRSERHDGVGPDLRHQPLICRMAWRAGTCESAPSR